MQHRSSLVGSLALSKWHQLRQRLSSSAIETKCETNKKKYKIKQQEFCKRNDCKKKLATFR